MFRALTRFLRRGLVDPAQLSLLIQDRPVADGSSRDREVRPMVVREPRRPRERRRLTPEEREEKIRARFVDRHAEFNRERFGGLLKPIEIRVSGRLRSKLGFYQLATPGKPGLIAISRRHLRRHGWDEAFETLLHEMVHQWQDENGQPVDHGAGFRAQARAGGAPAGPPAGRTPHRAEPLTAARSESVAFLHDD